jgi:hypothetical protein
MQKADYKTLDIALQNKREELLIMHRAWYQKDLQNQAIIKEIQSNHKRVEELKKIDAEITQDIEDKTKILELLTQKIENYQKLIK